MQNKNRCSHSVVLFINNEQPISYEINIGNFYSSLTLYMHNDMFFELFGKIPNIYKFSDILYSLTRRKFLLIEYQIESKISYLKFDMSTNDNYEIEDNDVLKLIDDIYAAKIQYDLKLGIEH